MVVFGGSGFIGSHLISALVADENTQVTSIDIRDPASVEPQVNYIRADVRDLRSLVLHKRIDSIYNLAAIHTTPGHPTHEYYETNIVGADNVISFAERHDVRRMVFTSSIAVYGAGEQRKTETSPVNPNSAYGWSKWIAEGLYRSWLSRQEGRQLVVCRPAVIFGTGENGNFTRLASVLRSGVFLYPGRTNTIKACFYVTDLIDTFTALQDRPEPFILYNASYPERYTIEQIVQTWRAVAFPSLRTAVIPKGFMIAAASGLKPFSKAGIGIHPDRIRKLMMSTDIVPEWLEQNGLAKFGRLKEALEDWKMRSNEMFK